MSAPALQARGLRKVYRSGFWMRPYVGLEGLDLEVPPGEVFGFIGPNGAGKTTTIKIFVGLHRATAGDALLFGVPASDPESRRQVGFLPERPYFYEHLSARELLRFYGELFEVPAHRLGRRIDELLERVELTRFADVPLRSYSKGMLQRAGLCQALLHEPRLVILDEPMSGLDPLGRALVRDAILAERDRGCTVFFSSHVLHDVETLSDRIAVLVRGKLRGVGTLDQLLGARTRHVELRAAAPAGGAPPPGLHRWLAREAGGQAVFHLPPDEADAALRALVGAGWTVLGFVPVRASLESLLIDEVEADRPVDPKRLGVLA
jgi:ABC-2 type transport system ATP-binding protein